MVRKEFEDRFLSDLLPKFCNHPERLYNIQGFRRNFGQIGDLDAANFLRAMDAGLVRLDDKLYKAPRTKEGEQLFWEYDRDTVPRETAISVEVVITIATLAVLHFDFGWPKECLGTQSLAPHRGALDVMAYSNGHYPNGYIGCEIKKTRAGTNKLISDMRKLGAELPVNIPKGSLATTNRKVVALHYWRIPVFWALGPDGYGSVFKMAYSEDGRMAFEEATLAELEYPALRVSQTENSN